MNGCGLFHFIYTLFAKMLDNSIIFVYNLARIFKDIKFSDYP